MASPARNKIYLLLIGILLLSNLALVAFFVLNTPPKKEVRRDRPGSFMKEALKNDVGFTDQQMSRFEEMATQHKAQMRPLFEDISKTKESFYRMLTQQGVPDSVLDNAAEQIGEKQEMIDLKIFTHFQNIRQLCTPDHTVKAVQRIFNPLPYIIVFVHTRLFDEKTTKNLCYFFCCS